MTFTVTDNQTGQKPDLRKIALEEEWARGLIYCDMDGFAVEEDGTLILLDECGNMAYCPEGRFTILSADREVGEEPVSTSARPERSEDVRGSNIEKSHHGG